MKLLKLEFFKCRRRKIVLVCAAVLAAELLWFGMYLTRQDAEDLVEGWMMLFYNLALIDAIFLPIKYLLISFSFMQLSPVINQRILQNHALGQEKREARAFFH